MSDLMKSEVLEGMILEIRGQRVLLDSDVAGIYGVETKRINEAVKNTLKNFPPCISSNSAERSGMD